MRGGYTIQIVTDDPYVFDNLPADREWEAVMVNWDTAESWRKTGADTPRSALADTENVGMQVVEEQPEAKCLHCNGVIVQRGGYWLLKEMIGEPGSTFCSKGGDHEPWHPLHAR